MGKDNNSTAMTMFHGARSRTRRQRDISSQLHSHPARYRRVPDRSTLNGFHGLARERPAYIIIRPVYAASAVQNTVCVCVRRNRIRMDRTRCSRLVRSSTLQYFIQYPKGIRTTAREEVLNRPPLKGRCEQSKSTCNGHVHLYTEHGGALTVVKKKNSCCHISMAEDVFILYNLWLRVYLWFENNTGYLFQRGNVKGIVVLVVIRLPATFGHFVATGECFTIRTLSFHAEIWRSKCGVFENSMPTPGPGLRNFRKPHEYRFRVVLR